MFLWVVATVIGCDLSRDSAYRDRKGLSKLPTSGESIYLLISGDEYLINEALHGICQEATDSLGIHRDELETVRMDATEAEPDELEEEISGVSMFSRGRMVVVSRIDETKENSVSVVANALERKPDTTYVIFLASEEKKSGILYKTVKKLGKVRRLSRLYAREILRLSREAASKEGITVSPSTLSYFCERCGYDLARIHRELDKLKVYGVGRGLVERSTISSLVPDKGNATIFELFDDMANSEPSRAFRVLEKQFEEGEVAIKVLITTARHLRDVLKVRELRESGASKDAITKRLQLHPYRASKLMEHSKSFETADLIDLLAEAVKADETIKSGVAVPENAVRDFMGSICHRAQKTS